MRTKDKLAEALRAEGLNDMATKAQDGYYDDFEGPLAMPITQLVNDLTAKGREDLAKRAANGEWGLNQRGIRSVVRTRRKGSPEKMKVTRISVRSGSTISNPYRGYSNIQSGINVDAEIQEGEDWEACAKELQIRADVAAAQHQQRQLEQLEVNYRTQAGATGSGHDRDEEDEREY